MVSNRSSPLLTDYELGLSLEVVVPLMMDCFLYQAERTTLCSHAVHRRRHLIHMLSIRPSARATTVAIFLGENRAVGTAIGAQCECVCVSVVTSRVTGGSILGVIFNDTLKGGCSPLGGRQREEATTSMTASGAQVNILCHGCGFSFQLLVNELSQKLPGCGPDSCEIEGGKGADTGKDIASLCKGSTGNWAAERDVLLVCCKVGLGRLVDAPFPPPSICQIRPLSCYMLSLLTLFDPDLYHGWMKAPDDALAVGPE